MFSTIPFFRARYDRNKLTGRGSLETRTVAAFVLSFPAGLFAPLPSAVAIVVRNEREPPRVYLNRAYCGHGHSRFERVGMRIIYA